MRMAPRRRFGANCLEVVEVLPFTFGGWNIFLPAMLIFCGVRRVGRRELYLKGLALIRVDHANSELVDSLASKSTRRK